MEERQQQPARDPSEAQDGKARMRAWLANLPPNVDKIYQDLRRIDPKGQRRDS